MQDREIACVNYVCEGECRIGRDGTFWDQCQTCKEYLPISGARPARKNLKREKLEKIAKDKRLW